MNHPRRVGSPPFGYDPRVMNRMDARGTPMPEPEFDDPYGPPGGQFDPNLPGPAFMEHPTHSSQYRRLPSAYRPPMRDPYAPMGTASYKILCITNINPKVGDEVLKDALTSDFSHFGDVSISLCHDSGERLAYIYFRTYEEAREARHTKSRSILFDRPIEIEPIYEPRTSPLSSPQPTGPPPASITPQATIYPHRRSITPPDPYYEMNVPLPPEAPRPLPMQPMDPHYRGGMSPPIYNRGYPPGPGAPSPSPNPAGPVSYSGRYNMPPNASPYSSPPHDPYRPYHPSGPYPNYSPSYWPSRDRERLEGPMPSRSPRAEPYYPPVEHRGFRPGPPPPGYHSSRSMHPSSVHHQQPPPHPRHHTPPTAPYHNHHKAPPSSYQSPPAHQSPPQRFMSREFRREKFEGHNSNQDDSRPSRVLIVNNIDATKSDDEVRGVFAPFGVIEDIEVRKVSADIASALVKFTSMDAAYKAKTATNGRYVGSLKCRIIYGKVNASRKLWIGGLSQTSTLAGLEDEVSRFGEVVSLDYTSGRPYAYVEYESANQAQFAAHHLKSSLIPALERKIRIEFVDTDKGDKRQQQPISRNNASLQVSDTSSRSRGTNESSANEALVTSPQSLGRKRSITPNELNTGKRACQEKEATESTGGNELILDLNTSASSALLTKARSTTSNAPPSELNNNQDLFKRQDRNDTDVTCTEGNASELKNEPSIPEKETSHANRSGKAADKNQRAIRDNLYGNRPRIEEIEIMTPDRLQHCSSIREIVNNCPVPWSGQLVLRNFIFPSRLFMCSGSRSSVEKYLIKPNCANGDQTPILKITQRWRLHPQPKLEEVKHRMQTANLGMILITSRSEQSPAQSSPSCKTPSTPSVNPNQTSTPKTNGDGESSKDNLDGGGDQGSASQSRPLKNLISYLEQKDAAGVISLGSSKTRDDGPKLLYAFPPGEFALNLLKQLSPKLLLESNKEEFLLGVVVGSGDTKV